MADVDTIVDEGLDKFRQRVSLWFRQKMSTVQVILNEIAI